MILYNYGFIISMLTNNSFKRRIEQIIIIYYIQFFYNQQIMLYAKRLIREGSHVELLSGNELSYHIIWLSCSHMCALAYKPNYLSLASSVDLMQETNNQLLGQKLLVAPSQTVSSRSIMISLFCICFYELKQPLQVLGL